MCADTRWGLRRLEQYLLACIRPCHFLASYGRFCFVVFAFGLCNFVPLLTHLFSRGLFAFKCDHFVFYGYVWNRTWAQWRLPSLHHLRHPCPGVSVIAFVVATFCRQPIIFSNSAFKDHQEASSGVSYEILHFFCVIVRFFVAFTVCQLRCRTDHVICGDRRPSADHASGCNFVRNFRLFFRL